MHDAEPIVRPKWPERRFEFVHPLWMLADFVERLRGTPDRMAALLSTVPPALLDRRPGDAWTIVQNAGHLADTDVLWMERFDDLRAGREVYAPADPDRFRAMAEEHRGCTADAVVAKLRASRSAYVAALESADAGLQRQSAFHGRLNTPLRLVDCAQFAAEHDDHHLLRIRSLVREFGG